MDIPALRGLLRPFVGNLKDQCTNDLIPEHCTKLGLPVPQDLGSKRERWYAAFDALEDKELPHFAQSLVDRRQLSPQLRNQVQDVLWSDVLVTAIPKRHRRDVARALQSLELFRHWDNFAQLLKDVFIVQEVATWIFLPDAPEGTLEEVHCHFVRNPEDANVEWLFEYLRVFDLSDKRFSVFLEGLASADVQVDAENQIAMVAAMNLPLGACGAEMRQTGEVGGYPVFNLVALHTRHSRPKNIIFASPIKPDIRFRDAVNNDVEIVSNAEECLVYDRPVSVEGLRWRELQQWWAETSKQDDPQLAKKTLYHRLLSCLPKSSPPQRLLFTSFYSAFRSAIPDLPALLPEVWLHWDPKTVAQRGAHALLNHRMDFLLLLPGGARIVIEVDGVQHYADDAGRADTRRYARLASGDRELKLVGYDVYRFGGIELQGPESSSIVEQFFKALFTRHGIKIS
jgi:very-short-patch-repair endonuclease